MRAASQITRETPVAFDRGTVLLRHEQAASRKRSHARRERLNLESRDFDLENSNFPQLEL